MGRERERGGGFYLVTDEKQEENAGVRPGSADKDHVERGVLAHSAACVSDSSYLPQTSLCLLMAALVCVYHQAERDAGSARSQRRTAGAVWPRCTIPS